MTNDEESKTLGVPLHSPALLFERVTRSAGGDIVEFTSSIYRGDRYRLVSELGDGRTAVDPGRARAAQQLRVTLVHTTVVVTIANGHNLVLTTSVPVCQDPTPWSVVFRHPRHHRLTLEDFSMKRRMVVALCLATVVAAAIAAVTFGATKKHAASSITVWLQVDAQSGWPKSVAAANKLFEQQNPGVTVNVQYQQWNTHLQKFDATLAGGNTPDVIEMGNSEMTKYMAAGAFADLTADKSKFPNSSTWLKGLAGLDDLRRQADGRARTTPGSRIVIYRKDLFKQAGITTPPTSLGAVRRRRQEDHGARTAPTPRSRRSTSPARTGTRRSPSSTTTAGRSRPSTDGKWTGTLDSPRAIAGLNAFKNTFLALSKASKSTDEANPFPTTPFAQGHAASFVGPGWQFGYALDPKAGNPKLKPVMGAFPMPSHTPGKTMPGFLGGSDLAIPAASQNQDLAEQWIADFTSERARWRAS